MCKPSKELEESYKGKTQEYATRGFRTLGVAVKEGGGEWKILGLLPMFDPPRSDTAAVRLPLPLKVIEADWGYRLSEKRLGSESRSRCLRVMRSLSPRRLASSFRSGRTFMILRGLSAVGCLDLRLVRLLVVAILVGLHGGQLHNFVESADGFAEVTPENVRLDLARLWDAY